MSSSSNIVDQQSSPITLSSEGRLKNQRTYAREDFEFGSLLGIGALAQVVHVRDTYTGEEYALKILDKKQLRRFGKVNQIVNEKDMLSKMDHPGIVKLSFTFQDSTWLYLALELCPNGELAELIARKGRLPIRLAQFYTGEIVNILTYLRKMGVAHRDIKPENLLITETGHLKLGDFDTSKVVMSGSHNSHARSERMNTFVGTAQYVSPEMLHDSAVAGFGSDLWALGCVVFQMLTGLPPFKSSSEYVTFQKILATEYSFPDNIAEVGQAFVRALLTLDPQDRLGFLDVSDLARHPFLNGLDLETLVDQDPPLGGILRLRKRRIRMTSEDANLFLSEEDSSDYDEQEEEYIDVSDEELGSEFGGMLPYSPTLVRCATTAPTSTELVEQTECNSGGVGGLKKIDSSPDFFGSHAILNKGRSRSMSHLQTNMEEVAGSPGLPGSNKSWATNRQFSSKPSVIVESLMARQAMEGGDATPDSGSAAQSSSALEVIMSFEASGTPRTNIALNNYLQRICASDERILMCGSVLKRRFFGRNRILVVTDLPRLIVLEHKSFRTVCEIPLLPSPTALPIPTASLSNLDPTNPPSLVGLCVSFVSPHEFTIETEVGTWRGEVKDGTAQAWVALIQAMKLKAVKVSSSRPSRSVLVTSNHDSTTRDILVRGQFGSIEAMGAIFTKTAFSSDLPTHEEIEAKAEARVEAALRKLSENPDNVDLISALTKQRSTEKSSAHEEKKEDLDDVFIQSGRRRENSTSCSIM